MNVLVVDDQVSVFEAVKFGMPKDVCWFAENGVVPTEVGEVDLILLDYNMPVKGPLLVEGLRARFPKALIVGHTTAVGDAKVRAAFGEAGVERVVRKFDYENIARELES
ncbi:hypothetical protein KA119_02345 [Candidatus Gracilibacteria bacterium]|nr:hypothetical protein [Candidatus Gracilibacteria bacterium]